ncbi:MAG: class I SAM-dependent methyltransferase, partial [Pseudomonadota bacterium]
MDKVVDYLTESKSSELYKCFLEHRPTKQLHNYIPLFVRHFEPVRLDVTRVLEIGVEAGTSLRMWADYFPNAEIVGFDIDPRCKIHETDRIKVIIGDQTKEDDLRRMPGAFDIIIDDGLHTQKAQMETFAFLYREKMSRRGIYVVEDCEKRVQTINYFKNLANMINWWPDDVHPSDWPKLNDLEAYLQTDSASPEAGDDRFYVRHTVGVSIYRHIIFVDRGDNPEDGTAHFRLNEKELCQKIGADRKEFLDLPGARPESLSPPAP